MIKHRLISCILSSLLCLTALSSAHAELRDFPQITVLSTSSLTASLSKVARSFSAEKEITVALSFDTDKEQTSNINVGSPADVFISADYTWMKELKQKGLIDVYTLKNLFSNRLCLVASSNSALSTRFIDNGHSISELLALIRERTLLVIGDPDTTTLGKYTLEALVSLDVENEVLPAAIRGGSDENTAYLIAKGDKAGIVYCSDAHKNPELVVFNTFPEDLHSPIIYQAAVVAGENMAIARNFIDYLTTAETQKIFTNHGFDVQ